MLGVWLIKSLTSDGFSLSKHAGFNGLLVCMISLVVVFDFVSDLKESLPSALRLSSNIVTTVTSEDFSQFFLRSGAHHLPLRGRLGSGMNVGMTPRTLKKVV